MRWYVVLVRAGLQVAGVVAVLALAGVLLRLWQDHSQAVHREELAAAALEQVPFRSLEDRLPKARGVPLPRPQSRAAAERWEFVARGLTPPGQRVEMLKALHEQGRKFFVESPGFGAGRIRESEESLVRRMLGTLEDGPPPPQPGPAASFPLSPGENLPAKEPVEDDYTFHFDHLHAFVFPTGFGYVKDRRHVAGFLPHGFRYLHSRPDSWWQLQHIQLVGILMGPQPVVYLSDKLPSMAVRHESKRALDYFEEAGLKALQGGEDLFVRQKEGTIRLLGALRATSKCLECHDGGQGDLLGALSYTLRIKSQE